MTCSHHYSIPEPDGPYSVGVCRLCGDKKMLANSLSQDRESITPEQRDAFGRIKGTKKQISIEPHKEHYYTSGYRKREA